MIERLPPGNPAELYLRISYTDSLSGTPHADTLERWDVAVLHAQDDFAVGSMVFYRVHLDRGVHAAHAMEDESEDLAEIASVILDADTGYFTDEVSEALEYVGSALLVMDRVTLDEARMNQLARRAVALQRPGRPLASLLAALLPPANEATDDIAMIAFRADRHLASQNSIG
ncbi:hypothetical protein [Streptomyces cyaneofuscatus]|uniref:hypothetical protein n=1 Tax=Streptomyces cyaneofuscatus TaxID=66883 RepID=UPI003320EFF7